MKRRPLDLPPLDSLPQTTCRNCGRSLINGLFTPLSLQSPRPECRRCIGELNGRWKANRVSGIAKL
jgi:hypothetical protein